MNENERMQFRQLGGSRQLILENAEQLRQVLRLDPAHWAVDVLPVDAVLTDPEFLAFLDMDKNGRIRPDELKSAIRWTLDVLSDYSGLNHRSDVLHFSALNPNHPDGVVLRNAARVVLDNLEVSGPEYITLAQTRDKKAILAAANYNGDGVITLSESNSPEMNACLKDMMTACGSVKDLGGEAGINREILDRFMKEGADLLAWRKQGDENLSTLPYGDHALSLFEAFSAVRGKLDQFFRSSEGLPGDGAERFGVSAKLDLFDAAAMDSFLEKAPIAKPEATGILCDKNWINPLWRGKLSVFLKRAYDAGALASPDSVTPSEWARICENYAWRISWMAGKKSDRFDFLSTETLELYLSEQFLSGLNELLELDLSVAREIESCDLLKKLILYQQNLLEFANNFVCLDRLFDPDHLSIIQPGVLILDSRHFTLASKVTDIAEHKRIVARSNICVMYVEMVRGTAPDLKKMVLAIAITSGSMINIFVGKTGVFVGCDGLEWDAKVIDLVQQPVSFSEALQMPFRRFGDFVGKQADKFFSSKSKSIAGDVEKSITSGKIPGNLLEKDPASKQTPAVSGSMLLMGGGVGIAALGSAFAFMADTLKNISVWNVVLVFCAIVLIISGPVLILSIIKLLSRSISDFLAAGGWAVNARMRLSHRMGVLFTYKPEYPEKVYFIHGDLIKVFSKKVRQTQAALPHSFGRPEWFFVLFFGLAALIAAAYLLFF